MVVEAIRLARIAPAARNAVGHAGSAARFLLHCRPPVTPALRRRARSPVTRNGGQIPGRRMPNTAKLVLESIEGEGLRFSATTGSRQRTVIDSGRGLVAPSPVETLLIAVGGCIAMDVISIMRKKRQRVTGYEVEVTGERRTEHPRAFTRIDILHRLRGHDLSAKAIEESIEVAKKYCSVQASLDPSIPVTSRFEILADADPTAP